MFIPDLSLNCSIPDPQSGVKNILNPGSASNHSIFNQKTSVTDPGSVPYRPLDLGWVKSKDPDMGSGMNNPDHIENFENYKNTISKGSQVCRSFQCTKL